MKEQNRLFARPAGLFVLWTTLLLAYGGPPIALGDSMIPDTPEFEHIREKVEAYDQRYIQFHSPDALSMNTHWNCNPLNPDTPECIPTAVVRYGGYSHLTAYGCNGASGEAFRYGALRNEGATPDPARICLMMDTLHAHHAITGVPGLIARGVWHPGLQGENPDPLPLFDEFGAPYPPEKRPVWREDNSGGLYPGYMWIDDVSQDCLIHYMYLLGILYEATYDDEDEEVVWRRERMIEDALAIGEHLIDPYHSLVVVDADGRATTFGNLNSHSLNGFSSLLALSILRTVYHMTGDVRFDDFYADTLLCERGEHNTFRNTFTLEVYVPLLYYWNNYFNFHMAWVAIFNLLRFEPLPAYRQLYQEALEDRMWTDPNGYKDVKEWRHIEYSMMYLALKAGGYDPFHPEDILAFDDMLLSMEEYPPSPFWDHPVDACGDDNEQCCEPGEFPCTKKYRIDGIRTSFGRLSATEPVHLYERPPNYYWMEKNPYRLQGGGYSDEEFPGIGLRMGYWMGRYLSAQGDNRSPHLRTARDPGYCPPACASCRLLHREPVSAFQGLIGWVAGFLLLLVHIRLLKGVLHRR